MTGAATVILAMGAGKAAAKAIDEELGKYDALEGVNHINYLSHTPSKILDSRYVPEFKVLMTNLSIMM